MPSPAPADAADRPAASPLARLYRATGLVLPVGLALFLTALALHHASDTLPSEYTWLHPLRILKNVMGRDLFPVAVVLAWTLGYVVRRPPRTWPAALRRLQAAPDAVLGRGRLAAAALGGLALVVADALLYDHGPVDRLAVLVVGAVIGARATSARLAGRVLLELAFVAAAFTGISYGFTILKALLFTVGVPHDPQIVAFESLLTGGTPPHRLVAAWAAGHPGLVWLCDEVYYLLFDHMFVVSVFLVGLGHPRARVEYLSALAFCYVLGAVTYYVYPGLGPAFFDPGAYAFLKEQPLDTNAFHALLARNTIAAREGTLPYVQSYEFIACMPSLHIAHELVMLWYARFSRVFLALSVVFTGLTMLAVVVLGWHYPIDILSGLVLAAAAIALAHAQRARLLPAPFMPPPEPGDARTPA